MDLLSRRTLDEMNNSIGTLHLHPYDDDSGDSRTQALSSVGSRTGPPVSPAKRKYHEEHGNSHDYDNHHMTKMSRLLTSHLGAPSNGDVRQEAWSHCHGSFEPQSSALSGLHLNRLYPPLPVFSMEQPLALTKTSLDTSRSSLLSPVGSSERQQNRPSVITCAPASSRPCSLSSCHMSPNTVKSKADEEHFRRSLGKVYKEPEPASNSVSITGSVDDHFAQALGETWLQIKAKGSSSRSPESSP